jgi:ribosome-associated protein
VAAEDLTVRPGVVIPGHELSMSVARAGGPGGQHVNKLSTKVVLRWSVRDSAVLRDDQRERLLKQLATRLTKEGQLVVAADGDRSQLANRAAARVRLAEMVRQGLHVPKKRRATKPTRGSQRRRLKAKKERKDVKQGRGRPSMDD